MWRPDTTRLTGLNRRCYTRTAAEQIDLIDGIEPRTCGSHRLGYGVVYGDRAKNNQRELEFKLTKHGTQT